MLETTMFLMRKSFAFWALFDWLLIDYFTFGPCGFLGLLLRGEILKISSTLGNHDK